MIEFINLCEEEPYLIFKKKYDAALAAGQKNIDAVSISSFNKTNNEVESRYVNLKYVNVNEFIFFSNYNSPKSMAFDSHNQISSLIFWSSINVQIRIKATIKKTSIEYNKKYFSKRAKDKNALAISSNQSKITSSYQEVINKYQKVKKNKDLLMCPKYWGGFSFNPYYFEFWVGHKSRINKREIFKKTDGIWKHAFLEP